MEPYNYYESNKDPNEILGQELFFWMYIVLAVITCFIAIFLYQELHKVHDSELGKENPEERKEVGRDKDFPFPVQFFTVTFLASVYIGVLYATDLGYYIYNQNNCNVFIVLKMMVMTIPVIVYVVFIAVKYYKLKCMSNTRRSTPLNMISSNIRREVWVGLLTLAIVLLILSIIPTLLLFFAHPLNTFTLLLTHIALFYTETTIGMLVIKQPNKCKWMVLKIIGLLMIAIVYPTAMWFYHIVFLRSLINNLAFKIFTKYIPSVVIAVFGYMYLIQKGKKDENEKKQQKSEKQSNNSDDHSDTLDAAKRKTD